MKKLKKFWIKQRENPQLGTYYVACGQLSNSEAKRRGRPLYGFNLMHPYDTEEDYFAALKKLRDEGHEVQ